MRNGRTVRDLRRENRTAVLQRLYFDGPMSRFSLGPATGLSSGSVSNVVAELVAEGLVEEAGSVDSAGGRPRTLLRVSSGSGFMIGVDVGETRIRIELFDLALTELARAERPLAVDGPHPHARYEVGVVVGHVRDGIAEVLRAAEVPVERLLGVGIGVPGIVARTPEDGAVVHGQTVDWDAVPLRQDPRPGRDVVRRRARRPQRRRRPLRLRRRRLRRHRSGGAGPGGRVGPSEGTGAGAPLPLRRPGLPGGVPAPASPT